MRPELCVNLSNARMTNGNTTKPQNANPNTDMRKLGSANHTTRLRTRRSSAGATKAYAWYKMIGNVAITPTMIESLSSTRMISAGEKTCNEMPCKNSASTNFRIVGIKGNATMETTMTAAIEISRRRRSSAKCSVNVISTSSEAGGTAGTGASAVFVDITGYRRLRFAAVWSVARCSQAERCWATFALWCLHRRTGGSRVDVTHHAAPLRILSSLRPSSVPAWEFGPLQTTEPRDQRRSRSRVP